MELTQIGKIVLGILVAYVALQIVTHFCKSVEKFSNTQHNIIPKIIYMCCKDKNGVPEKVTRNWKTIES